MSMSGFMVDLPECVRRVEGVSGLPALEVLGPRSSGVVQLHGGQVTSFVPRGGRELLWLSPLAQAGPSMAIRGGVPVCLPWFGAGRDGGLSPSHGLARRARWRLHSVREEGEAVIVSLVVTPEAVAQLDGAEHWPLGLFATLEITFGDALGLRLVVRNEGSDPLTFEAALHTYLAVDDVRTVRVEGLTGASMLDQASGERSRVEGDLTFDGEVDVVVTAPKQPITVVQGRTEGRTPIYRIERENLPDAVVWNPAQQKTASLADVPDDAWPRFVCVEAATIKDDAVTLTPGQDTALGATYAPLAD